MNYNGHNMSAAFKRYRRQNTDQQCKIPNYSNSTYKIINDPETVYNPGDYVKKFGLLEIICDEGYKLPPFTPNSFHCFNGQWSDLPPPCLRVCPSLMSSVSTTVRCEYNDSVPLHNCINPVHGTTVHLSCNSFYEADETINRNPTRACDNQGKWTPSLAQCYPTCGTRSPRGKFHTLKGGIASPGDSPWHVGIYTNTKEFRCSGSIINQNIILSAAHCFADLNGNIQSAENYLLAAGKYYRKYDDTRDIFVQYSNVHKIFVPKEYSRVDGLHAYDIAVVIVESSFDLSVSVLPVCIKLNADSENTNDLPNRNIASNWGYSHGYQDPSDELNELIIPTLPYDTCYNEVQISFKDYIMFDKTCSYSNQGTSVCQGNSGGGLIKHINDHFYVTGVASIPPVSAESSTSTPCNPPQFGLYTSVIHHFKFIRKLITNYGWKESIECERYNCTYYEESEVTTKPADSRTESMKCKENNCTIEKPDNKNNCRLPNFPEHGSYRFPDGYTKYKPGNYAPLFNLIELRCDIGYKANPSSTFLLCQSQGKWVPAVGTCTRIQTINRNSEKKFETLKISSRFNNIDFQLLQMFYHGHTNYFISPASIKLTLAMLLEGSKGKSAQEISQVLGIPVDVNSTRGTLNKLIDDFSTKAGNTVLTVNNVFAVSNKYTIRQEYRNLLQDRYKTQATSVDFRNFEQSASNGLIREIINAERLTKDASLVIANYLFFRAQWRYPFTAHVTSFVHVYAKANGNSWDVDALQVESQFRYKFFKKLDCQAVELPYNDEENAMLILLPKEHNAVSKLQRALLRANFSSIIDKLETTNMKVVLPKFEVQYSTNLRSMLEMMGVNEIFSKSANLSGIVENGEIKVDRIIHKADMEVNEKGKYQYPLIAHARGLVSESVIANRPFLFFIYNMISKNILFEGRLNSPELASTPISNTLGKPRKR